MYICFSKLCLRCEDLCSTNPCAEMLTHVWPMYVKIVYLSKTYTGKPTFVSFQYSSLDNESYTCIPETGYKQKNS